MARRFVTYNTEDQAAGLVNVDERGVMKPEYLPKPLVFERIGGDYSVNMSFEQWCAIYDVDKHHRVIKTDSGGNIDYLTRVNNNRGDAVPHFAFMFVSLNDDLAYTELYFLEDGTVTLTNPVGK